MTALDASVAIPAVLAWHEHHHQCQEAARGSRLPGHALIEAFSVMTRLPAPHRIEASTADLLLRRWSDEALILGASPALQRRIVALVAEAALAGGAIYDALIGLTASEHGRLLLTRDARAASTYERLNIEFEVLDPGG